MKATITEPVIIKEMSVSIQHLSLKDRQKLKKSPFPLYAKPYYFTKSKIWHTRVNVPQGKLFEKIMGAARNLGFSNELTDILLFAKIRGCPYVLFSTDGTLYHDLPVFKEKGKRK